MKKHLLFVLIFLFAGLVNAQSICTEAELKLKKDQLTHFRIPALQGREKLHTYIQIASPVVANFSTLYAEYEKNKKEGQAHLNQLCSIMDQIAMMADDLLSGGDGLGQKKPWLKQNPESLFRTIEAYKAYCASSAACNTAEARKIQEQLESLAELLVRGNDPAELVDEYYDSIKNFLPQNK